MAGASASRWQEAHAARRPSRGSSTIGILDFVAPMHFPHGETSCQEADGGTACFMFTFPRGVGFELDQVRQLPP